MKRPFAAVLLASMNEAKSTGTGLEVVDGYNVNMKMIDE